MYVLHSPCLILHSDSIFFRLCTSSFQTGCTLLPITDLLFKPWYSDVVEHTGAVLKHFTESKLENMARMVASPESMFVTQRRIFLSFVLTKPWSHFAPGFLRAEADFKGNKQSAVITSHLSSPERIIWTQFGLRRVTGRRCYGNKTKAVSYLALCKKLCERTQTTRQAQARWLGINIKMAHVVSWLSLWIWITIKSPTPPAPIQSLQEARLIITCNRKWLKFSRINYGLFQELRMPVSQSQRFNWWATVAFAYFYPSIKQKLCWIGDCQMQTDMSQFCWVLPFTAEEVLVHQERHNQLIYY